MENGNVSARTGLLQVLLRADDEGSRLIRDGRDELVVDQDNFVVLCTALGDEVGDGRGVSEGGDVTTNLVEGDRKVLTEGTLKLVLGLVTNNSNLGLGVDLDVLEGGFGVVGEGAAGGLGDGRVDTAAETLVGGDDNEELLAVSLVARVREHLCRESELTVSNWVGVHIPALAKPYSLPACMARWAFASLVEAIIFMDCRRVSTRSEKQDSTAPW